MTSNLGSDIIRDSFENFNENNSEEIVEKTKHKVFELLKRSVRPEFLNRIDELVMFKPLTRRDISGIIKIQLNHLLMVLNKQQITFHMTDSCLDYLVENGYDVQFGARPLKRLIHKKIMDIISMAMLQDKVKPGSHMVIDLHDGQPRIRTADTENENKITNF